MSVKPPTHQLMITSNKIKLFFPYFFLTSFSQFLFIYLFIFFLRSALVFHGCPCLTKYLIETSLKVSQVWRMMKRKQENQVETCHYSDDFHFDARKVRHILPLRHIMEQCRRYLVRSWGPYFHIFSAGSYQSSKSLVFLYRCVW